MNIFLSYASPSRPLAEELCHRLQAGGHEVFFDREDLPAGQSFDDHIRSAIEVCELFIFLVTPDAVTPGRYTLTELKLASRRWPTPGLHVLPVLAEPTPFDKVPAYLRALNLLQPEGNLSAEVLIEVQDRRSALQAAANVPANSPVNAPALPTGPTGADPAAPRYRTLTLRFEHSGDSLRLCLPGLAPEALVLDLPALEQRLWAGATDLGDSARRASPQAAWLPGAEAVRAVGQVLHEAIFGSASGAALAAQLRAVNPQSGEGLRVVVDTTAAPGLSRLPWEFLYNAAQEDFVFSDRLKPLVRRLDVDAPPPRLKVQLPLRLLVAVSAPTGRPDLQVGAELAQLDRALATLTDRGQLTTERLDHTTLEALDEALLRYRPHLLHFIGHGDFDGEQGQLLLEGEGGVAAPVAGRQLAVLLRNHLGSLRLVFLNNCMGAAASGRDAFGGVAQSLLRRGVPAVVAMQFPIADTEALTLARHFYRYLAAGQPVDTALTSARAFMVARGDAVAWGAAALYMNAEDGRLFDLAPATVPAAAVVQGEPAPVNAVPPTPPAAPTPLPSAPSQGGRKPWGLIAGVLLMMGAAVAWISFTEVPANSPAPSPPSPTPVATVPSPDQAAEIVQWLRSGDIVRAEAALAAMSPGDIDRLRAQGALLPLAEAVLARAEQAIAAGQADMAAGLLGRVEDAMAPLPPPLQARADALRVALVPPEELIATGSSGAVDSYRIRPGDTLWSLAARFRGDARQWPVLWQRHQQAAELGIVPPIADPDRLRIGQPLHIPSDHPSGNGALRYHVQAGDTLSSIAQRIDGDASRWRVIQQMNDLPDADLIVPGQVLWLSPGRR